MSRLDRLLRALKPVRMLVAGINGISSEKHCFLQVCKLPGWIRMIRPLLSVNTVNVEGYS